MFNIPFPPIFTVKNLLNTIPSLNDKISEVENLTSQFSPLSNISENIKKIKELIEQARDAANKVRCLPVSQSASDCSVSPSHFYFTLFSPDLHPNEVHRQRSRGAASAGGPGGSEGLHVAGVVAAEARRQR